jgi:hypothetical protein
MQIALSLKKTLLASAALLALGAGIGIAANKYGKPKSVIHVVTLYYKDGTTDAQKKAVLDGIEKMAASIPGIKNVWLRPIKVQGNVQEKQPDGTVQNKMMTDAFVIEFENEEALKVYADHPAHKEWEKIYVPVRGQSRTSDITN